MQNTKGKGGDYSPSRHKQPQAPRQQPQNPQHHNSVVGLYTHQQQTKAQQDAQALDAVVRRPGQ